MTPEDFQTGLNALLDNTQPKGVNGSKGITKAIFKSIGLLFKNMYTEVLGVSSSSAAASAAATAAVANVNAIVSSTGVVTEVAYSNPELGNFRPWMNVLRMGKKLFQDEEFVASVNGIDLYNNVGGGGLVMTRLTAQANLPNSSGCCLRFSFDLSLGNTSPGFGGLFQSFNFKSNSRYAHVFRAKLPVGYSFNGISNSRGNNGKITFITPAAGTGKWEDYAVLIETGNSGTFENGGGIYVSGPGIVALQWFLASSTVFDLNVFSDLQAREIQLQPSGTSVVFNIRRPYKFSWTILHNDGVTINAQPAGTVNANTDALLTLTGTAGKTVTLNIQQTI